MEERALALGGRLEIRSTPSGGTTIALVVSSRGADPGTAQGAWGPVSHTIFFSPFSSDHTAISGARLTRQK